MAKKKTAKKPAPVVKTPKEKKPTSKADSICKSLIKEYGADVLIKPEEYEKRSYPTGSRQLDIALGVRGWTGGRIIEIFGREQSGKTTLVLHSIAEAQGDGKLCGIVDLEKLDIPYAKRIGVDVNKLIIAQPKESSMILDVTLGLVRKGVDFVAVDSIAALSPKSELEQSIGKDTMAIVARQLGRCTRQTLDPLFANGSVVVFINQIRDKMNSMGYAMTTTPGGNALRGFAGVRVEVKKGLGIYIGDVEVKDEITEETVKITRKRKTDDAGWKKRTQIGQGTLLYVVKNKVGIPYKRVEIDIRLGEGIDKEVETYDLACMFKVLETAGAGVVRLVDKTSGEILAKSQNKYDMIDLLLRHNYWGRIEKEVEDEWTKRGAFQDSSCVDILSSEDSSTE